MASRLDLQPLWQPEPPRPDRRPALADPWGERQRPDWAARGLIIWPRGGRELRLRLRLTRPSDWDALTEVAVARLCLRWWAEAAELQVDGAAVHRGDLFDTACRWPLPPRWWQGEALDLELRLTSPRHDDGALIHSHLELEPRDPADPHGLLAPVIAELDDLRREQGLPAGAVAGSVQVLGHAHLDLAWLWPVAETWAAAERTFTSVLALMERWPELRFGHSTPALYAWLEQHRPTLFQRIRQAMGRGRWEPLNGPWVECDCQLIDTPSLLRQFQLGQHYSRRAFPEWRHEVAWLPDSFGFAAGLPAVARATGVRWFCTHKLAWNATNPFPHRIFRWRSRCGAELLALMTAPIGTDGDPVAIETQRLAWQRVSGVDALLWLPGVGDHGGGPTAEMLEQLTLWQQQPAMAPLRHGTLREHLAGLEALAPRLPVWRDELYLELHRGCATSRPDQKRHNRTLERLLREAELARALLTAARGPRGRAALHEIPQATGPALGAAAGRTSTPVVEAKEAPSDTPAGPGPWLPVRPLTRQAPDVLPVDWRPLLFQQFHDILPGTSIPEVFEQAEPQWRNARRQARRQRDQALLQGLQPGAGLPAAGSGAEGAHEPWWAVQLLPLPAAPRCVRLPAGAWRLLRAARGGRPLHAQAVPEGGAWLQLPMAAGVSALAISRATPEVSTPQRSTPPGWGAEDSATETPLPIEHPVSLQATDAGGWVLDNGLISARCGPQGVEQLWNADGQALLAAPLRWCRWRDRGEFWDAWDLAPDHRDHPLPWDWERGAEVHAAGPLCTELIWRGRCGESPLRLTARLLAGTPWLELLLSVDWRQRHEVLQLELPLAGAQTRWAGDTAGGVIERPAVAHTERERSRWEVTALSWIAAPELAVLLDGPQGVSATAERLTVSLLRAPTWPDPGADNGLQRLRLGLMAAPGGWRAARVPQQARRLREPLWLRPWASAAADAGGAGAEGTVASPRKTPPPAPATPGSAAMAPGTAGMEGRGVAADRVDWPGFPDLGEDLRLLGLRTADAMGQAEAPGESGGSDRGPAPAAMEGEDPPGTAGGDFHPQNLILTLQNEGPCRRRLQLPPPWRVMERLDALDQPLQPAAGGDPLHIGPWQLCCWRLLHEGAPPEG